MRRRRKPTFDEGMHFLRETKKLRAKQQTTMKTPMIVMLPANPPVKDGLADDRGD